MFFGAFGMQAACAGTLIKVNGQACEVVSEDVSKASARVKAVDKAAFMAVSNLEMLQQYREQLDMHDFNVLVYSVVDEYLEDMDVRSSTEGDRLCAEMTAYVSPKNVEKAVDATLMRLSQQEVLVDETPLKTAELSEEISEELEERRQEEEKRQQAELAQKEVLFSGTPKPAADLPAPAGKIENTQAAAEQILTQPPQPLEKDDDRALVFVHPMAFFDQSHSVQYARLIKDWFADNEHFLITDNMELADYILSPKVLRAKTEPINRETNRLQMVISLELETVATHDKQIEHQNRFVLYENTDNEQQTAYHLMKKLFSNACEILAKTMLHQEKQSGRLSALPSVITPAGH